jgi:hypothetical protein
MNIRKVLENKLGSLDDEVFNFAIEQFERNSEQVQKLNKKMSTAESLDELSTNIDFYYTQIRR